MVIAPKAWFSPGFVSYTTTSQSAAREADLTLVGCLLRHLTGDFGRISAEQAVINTRVLDGGQANVTSHDDIESRYPLLNGQQLVFITHYVHSPQLRWTDICLDNEVVDGLPASNPATGEPDLDDVDLNEIIGVAR
jgi:hypothetical protein